MNKRIEQLDVIRSIAIVLVIINHAVELKYNVSDLNFINSVGTVSKIFSVICCTAGRLGVPLFLMLTGHLVASRSYGDDGRKRFYKKSLLPLLVTVEVWIILLNVFVCLFYGYEFDFNLLVRQMLFLTDLPQIHMWYMPMILGMYLFVPFVSDAFRKIKTKAVIVPMIVSVVVVFVLPYVNRLYIVNDEPAVSSALDISFSGGTYGIYLILGILLNRKFLKKINVFIVALVGVASFAAATAFQLYFYDKGYAYPVWYNSVFILISAVSLFEVVSRIDRVRLGDLFRSLSECSFGIYLIHMSILLLMEEPIDGIVGRASYRSFLLMLSALIISWCIVYVIGKIPRVRKVLFFIK